MGIRVLVVDDHPAVTAGLERLLRGEADIDLIGTAADRHGAMQMARERLPDVVVLDYALGDDEGLPACFDLKQLPDPPAVVLYSAYVDPVFAVPAAIAQADATVAESAPADQLLATIRRVASGKHRRARLDPELVEAASARLLVDDLLVAGMLLGAKPAAEIADMLDLSVAEVGERAHRILGRLQAGQSAVPTVQPLANA